MQVAAGQRAVDSHAQPVGVQALQALHCLLNPVEGTGNAAHLIVHPADICGRITGEVAQKTGLSEGTPVAGGLYDISSAGVATGMTDETTMNVIVGTWCNNQYAGKTPVIDQTFFSTSVYAVPDYQRGTTLFEL